MKETPIIEALSQDATLWLLFCWFNRQNDEPEKSRLISSKLYDELDRRIEDGDNKRISQINSEINRYFKSLLPDIITIIKVEEINGPN